MRLRAYGVPSEFGMGPIAEADRMVLDAFRQRYPWIDPISTVGLQIPGGRTMDMVPFMQIAGDIAPDVMYVNFRQSHTYIHMKLLYPLDAYIEAEAGVSLRDGSLLGNDDYVAELRRGATWDRIEQRVPPLLWPVIRRECPFEESCPHRAANALPSAKRHRHVWSYPIAPQVIVLKFDRSLFAERGVPQRAPRDWDEMLAFAKLLTNPAEKAYGVEISLDMPSWYFLSFLYSAGGKVVEQDEATGEWHCVLDSDAAVEAAYFYARLRLERFESDGRQQQGVIATSTGLPGAELRYGMRFVYLDSRFLTEASADQQYGIGPVPTGPGGIRGSEFNSKMCGIFSGLAGDQRRRDAAWEYIRFYDGPEARRIRTEKMVEAGLGRFVRPPVLRQFNDDGRYDDILLQIPPELEEMYQVAMNSGVPEPYGKNCQFVYDQVNRPLGEIWRDAEVERAIADGNSAAGKRRIREILGRATGRINERMLGQLPPAERQRRKAVAWVVVVAVAAVFVLVMRKVFRSFRPPDAESLTGTDRPRRDYRFAYLLLTPAVASILLWTYWPLVSGSMIAFQNYSVLGDSRWVGVANFADVLFDAEFWHSMGISLIYALLFMVFGFWTPIALAFFLSEVPRGKVLFRTIYYLPAVLSGVVVIFLWKSFYGPEGMINQVVNSAIALSNAVLQTNFAEVQTNWLDSSRMALFFCLLPTVWAGLGPGCLIYLAALKTVPDELYEAADIDGAGVATKIFGVALPSIKALVTINFVGAMIGAIRGAGGFILAMTGGGPFGELGGATEVIGLKLFYTTFGYLQFGPGAAMAWVLGSMLIGFAVIQIQRLSRMEFRTAEKVA